MANISVFCSSSNEVDGEYRNIAREVGMLIGTRNHRLIYGGSQLGLMGEVAGAVKENGGRITGVIPKYWEKLTAGEDEIILSVCLDDRKKIINSLAEGTIVLPGAAGTLDELATLLALASIEVHKKPISILNVNNFYNPLIEMFSSMKCQGFCRYSINDLVYVSDNPLKAIEHLEERFRLTK